MSDFRLVVKVAVRPLDSYIRATAALRQACPSSQIMAIDVLPASPRLIPVSLGAMSMAFRAVY